MNSCLDITCSIFDVIKVFDSEEVNLDVASCW